MHLYLAQRPHEAHQEVHLHGHRHRLRQQVRQELQPLGAEGGALAAGVLQGIELPDLDGRLCYGFVHV